MKKIPTLFTRVFDNHKIVEVLDEITPGCEDAFKNGIATVKYDGACCAVINGIFYKRFDAKNGKTPPEGAIPCCDPDPITGHWPHWVKVDRNNPADKWFVEAYKNFEQCAYNHTNLSNGTYECVGPKINGNPYNFPSCLESFLIRHGVDEINVDRTFNGIKDYLNTHFIEGLVFWLNGEPVCKIKRSDFGLKWP